MKMTEQSDAQLSELTERQQVGQTFLSAQESGKQGRIGRTRKSTLPASSSVAFFAPFATSLVALFAALLIALLPHICELAGQMKSKLLLVHVADGWAARNFEQLELAESEEMKEDRAYLEGVRVGVAVDRKAE